MNTALSTIFICPSNLSNLHMCLPIPNSSIWLQVALERQMHSWSDEELQFITLFHYIALRPDSPFHSITPTDHLWLQNDLPFAFATTFRFEQCAFHVVVNDALHFSFFFTYLLFVCFCPTYFYCLKQSHPSVIQISNHSEIFFMSAWTMQNNHGKQNFELLLRVTGTLGFCLSKWACKYLMCFGQGCPCI